MNIVLQTICERSSVRNYLDRPISDSEMAILETAALAAPTSLDLQQQKFFFIRKRELLAVIEKGVIEAAKERNEDDYLQRLAERENKVLFGAPLLIIIAVNTANNYIDVDAGIAVQSIALAARSVGLDSVIMAAPDRIFTGPDSGRYTDLIGFPPGFRFAISIAVGYAALPKIPHTHTLDNIIRFD